LLLLPGIDWQAVCGNEPNFESIAPMPEKSTSLKKVSDKSTKQELLEAYYTLVEQSRKPGVEK
jgi:hypothetical protein